MKKTVSLKISRPEILKLIENAYDINIGSCSVMMDGSDATTTGLNWNLIIDWEEIL